VSRLPPVLSRHDLPQAELLAARLDGEVYPVADCFCPIDEIEQSSHRGAALAALIPGRLIAEQLTAAWVLGATRAPPGHRQFCTDIGARIRPAGLVSVTVREVVIGPDEVQNCGGLSVTAPLRTVLDLARFTPRFTSDHYRVTAELMRLGRFGAEECLATLDRRRNLPGKRRALERIVDAAERAQPPLTRYTS
jgi:hypothetical protein